MIFPFTIGYDEATLEKLAEKSEGDEGLPTQRPTKVLSLQFFISKIR